MTSNRSSSPSMIHFGLVTPRSLPGGGFPLRATPRLRSECDSGTLVLHLYSMDNITRIMCQGESVFTRTLRHEE